MYYLHETFDDTCSVPLGVGVEGTGLGDVIVAVRQGALHVLGLPDGSTAYAIMDLDGRTIQHGNVFSGGGRTDPIALFGLARGIYLLALADRPTERFAVWE